MERLAMRLSGGSAVILGLGVLLVPAVLSSKSQTENAKGDKTPLGTFFRTSERCVACHNGLKASSGEDISIGFEWSASIMANSSRDPYWQGSVRRESMDHPESKQVIEDECSICHMPAVRMSDRAAGRHTQLFSRFPIQKFPHGDRAAADGVTCSVCHQIDKSGLGTDATFVGNVVFAKPVQNDERPEYGPFDIDKGHQTVMHSSTATYFPTRGDHMRDAGLCGSCHTLYTAALGPNGEKLAKFPEQMPFQEWQHSDYATKQTCQDCHMPVLNEAVAVTALYGQPREGMHRHVFVGSNFVMEGMLQDHRDELATEALPEEMDAAMRRTAEFLKTQAAKATISRLDATPNGLAVDVHVENLGGHKLPTAYPSRRAWLHFLLKDSNERGLFESGALNPDGSIVGNGNDEDPLKFAPHYREITRSEKVGIYEPILRDLGGEGIHRLFPSVGVIRGN